MAMAASAVAEPALSHALVERGQWQDTLLVVTSDHGTQLLEHGKFGKDNRHMHAYNTQVNLLVRVYDKTGAPLTPAFKLSSLWASAGLTDACATTDDGDPIVLYDQSDKEIARWNFEAAWPSKITGPSLNANGNDIAVEELVICHEGLKREK